MLCATAHLRGEYAESAADTLLTPSFTAIAPSWGLDPVALAQHAKLASHRRKERDRSLRYLLAGMILIPLAVIALALSGQLSPTAVGLSVLAISAGGLAAAWMIVFAHYELIRVSVLELKNDRLAPRDTAPALDQNTQRRLEALADANVVVFSGYQPFVGCGVTLDSWTLCTDLAPATDAEAVPFDPLDLQRYLLRTVPPQNLEDMWAMPQLFVTGAVATAVPELIPDLSEPDTWPASQLPADVLDRFTRKPSKDARTYTCLVLPSWQGELVVSTLFRAELAGTRLFVEGRAHALLPPRAMFRESKFVPKHPRRAWLAVARSVAPVLIPLLFGCYQRKFELMRAAHRRTRDRQRLRKKLAEGCPFNYGASSSLREDAADPTALKYYTSVDEIRSFRILKRQVLVSVEEYLADHGVDVEDFHRQAMRCLQETTVHLHDLPASAVSFGPQNTVTGPVRNTP
jgi:heme exporter protein D